MALMNDMEIFLGIKERGSGEREYVLTNSFLELMEEQYDVYPVSFGYRIPGRKYYITYMDEEDRVHIQSVFEFDLAYDGFEKFTDINDLINHILREMDFEGPFVTMYDEENDDIIISSGILYNTLYEAVTAGREIQNEYLKRKVFSLTDLELEKKDAYYCINQILDIEDSSMTVREYVDDIKRERVKKNGEERKCSS